MNGRWQCLNIVEYNCCSRLRDSKGP